jgi:hypothetical protein
MLLTNYLLFAPVASALIAKGAPSAALAPSLAIVKREPGPCDVDACMDVIDSSACWNAVVMSKTKDLQSIFTCTAGGKTQVCVLSGRRRIVSVGASENASQV